MERSSGRYVNIIHNRRGGTTTQSLTNNNNNQQQHLDNHHQHNHVGSGHHHQHQHQHHHHHHQHQHQHQHRSTSNSTQLSIHANNLNLSTTITMPIVYGGEPLTQHDDLIRYIKEAWTKISENGRSVVYNTDADQQLKNFKPFNLEEYWGQRLVQNIHVTHGHQS